MTTVPPERFLIEAIAAHIVHLDQVLLDNAALIATITATARQDRLAFAQNAAQITAAIASLNP
jgi:hypothetical protein